MRLGGIGQVEEGKLKGRKFLIPSLVYVEKGTHPSGSIEYAQACLIHQKFIKSDYCDECRTEIEEKQKEAKEIGL